MKKRISLLITAVCLMFTSVLSSSVMVSAKSTFTEPSLGEEIHGFIVKDTTYDKTTKSNKILLEHENTGAKLLVINNNDVNRGFSIKFNTPPDNRGSNHILEHSVLGGSEKYPTKNSIFDVMNTTYVSFANALTYPNMTMYPICSQNEEQLLKSADIYLDAVFNPLFLSDQRIFEREGWRYELADESSGLTYNGIVYNEMQGNLGNITTAAISNANMAIFPDTDQGNNAGGIPSEILTLSYEDLIETYDKYYHPSNSFIVLYGDLDYERFLNMIDKDYFSSYTSKTINIKRDVQKPFDKLVEKTYSFPVAEGTDTNNKSTIDIVFAVDDISELGMEGFMKLNLALSILNLDNSNFKKAMMKSQIGESYLITMDITTYQPTIHFIAMNSDSSRSKEFYDIVMKELKKVVSNGMNTDLVNSLVRNTEFEELIDSGNAVNELMLSSMLENLLDNPLENYLNYIRVISEKLDENVLEESIKNQLVNNKLVALTVTKPEPGLLERNMADLFNKLAEKKASMTEEEIRDLVNKTGEFSIWSNEGTSDEVLKSLRAVDLKDITIELKNREINEEKVDGVHLWSTQADVDKISNIQMNFDLSHLTKEELLYLKFYNQMISSGMDTKNRNEMDVINDMTNMLYSMSTSIGAYGDDDEDTSAHPIYSLNYYSLDDEYDKTFDLVYDILLESDIENISTYGKRTIANIKANYEIEFAEPIGIAQYRSLAYTSAKYRLINYLNGLDYYNFILSLEKEIASNPNDVYYKLLAVRAKAFTYNKDNIQVLFAGDSSSLEKFKENLPEFTVKFRDAGFLKEKYTLPVPAKREALVINSPVQYLSVNASLTENEVPMSNKDLVISTILNNLMLTPEIRLKGGAYGVAATFTENNYLVYTYRDSNFVNSLNVIGATDEFLTAILPYITEETLESYILSLFGTVNQSGGELNDAMSVLIEKYYGLTRQDKIDGFNEIRSTTISDIEEYANYLSSINENLNYVVVASPDEIEQNKDLFDAVIILD